MRRRLLCLLLLCSPVFSQVVVVARHRPPAAGGSCGNGFAHCGTVTLPASTGTNVSSFPIGVALSDINLKSVAHGGYVQNGWDIVPSTSSNCATPLYYQADPGFNNGWDDTNGVWLGWIRYNAVSSGTTAITLCVGKSGLSSSQAAGNPFDSTFALVAHFAGSATDWSENGQTVPDSSGHFASGAAYRGMVPLTAAAGIMGGAVVWPGRLTDGDNDNCGLGDGSQGTNPYANAYHGTYIDFGTSVATWSGGVGSYSYWVYPTFSGSWPVTFGRSLSGSNDYGVWAGSYDAVQGHGSDLKPGFPIYGGASDIAASTVAIGTNAWHHILLTSDGATSYVYIDGTQAGSASSAMPALAGQLLLGNNGADWCGNNRGRLDELRIGTANRSAAWAALEYSSIHAPVTGVTSWQ